jgi:hypothetical protein
MLAVPTLVQVDDVTNLSILYSSMGQPEESRTSHFFIFTVLSLRDRAAEKDLIFFCEGPGGGKNAQKIPVCPCLYILRGNNFTPARARCGPDFTSRGRRAKAPQLLMGP